MAGDFRKVEQELAEYFRREGCKSTALNGDLYLGICSTEVDIKTGKDGEETGDVIIPKGPTVRVISLTRLARDLAESA